MRRTLGVDDYFGEISVIDGKPRSASVEAVGAPQTFAIHPHVVQTLMDDHPDFARGSLVRLCKRLREAEKHSSSSAWSSAKQQLLRDGPHQGHELLLVGQFREHRLS